jgi:aspartate racemase
VIGEVKTSRRRALSAQPSGFLNMDGPLNKEEGGINIPENSAAYEKRIRRASGEQFRWNSRYQGVIVKTIGLIGGMSWESSLEYYRILNETTKAKLGGLHSARCILYSVDFAEVEALQHQDRWEEAAQLMVAAGQSLERAGADFIILCTNTMHKLADEIQAHTHIPFLHIADATAQRIKSASLRKVGLLGTPSPWSMTFTKAAWLTSMGWTSSHRIAKIARWSTASSMMNCVWVL